MRYSRNAKQGADVKSPEFASGAGLELAEVKSDVEVVPSAAQASASLAQLEAAVAKPGARTCLEAKISQVFAKGVSKAASASAKITLGHTTVSLLSPSVPRSFGLQITLPIKVALKGIEIPMHVYVRAIGFIAGPAEITLTTTGLSKPFPASTEQRLLSTLASRANEPHHLRAEERRGSR